MADLIFTGSQVFGLVLTACVVAGLVGAFLATAGMNRSPDDDDAPVTAMQAEWRLYMQAYRNGEVRSWDEWKHKRERV